MTIPLSFKLLDTQQKTELNVLGAVRHEVNALMAKVIPRIEEKVQRVARNTFINSQEVNDFIFGRMRAELGNPNIQDDMTEIVDILSAGIIINQKMARRVGSNIQGGFRLTGVQADFEDILSSAAAEFEDSARGYSLPWLKWLLLEGNSVIVRDYQVVFGGRNMFFSRTGEALMRPLGRNSTGGWRVPAQYAGTASNNFITRIIDNELLPKLESIIIAELERG